MSMIILNTDILWTRNSQHCGCVYSNVSPVLTLAPHFLTAVIVQILLDAVTNDAVVVMVISV